MIFMTFLCTRSPRDRRHAAARGRRVGPRIRTEARSDGAPNPTASVTSERDLLKQFPASKGASTFPIPKAAVLIQPAGRTWDYFHEVLPALGRGHRDPRHHRATRLAYLIFGGSGLQRGVRDRKSSASRRLRDFHIG